MRSLVNTKTKGLVERLVREQLAWVGYEGDLPTSPQWYKEYRFHTKTMEQCFERWVADVLWKELKMTKKRARVEAQYFMLNWGLATSTPSSGSESTSSSTTNTSQAPKE